MATLTLLGGTYLFCRKKGYTNLLFMPSQSYADVMVIPSAPESVENSAPSQRKYVSVLEEGPFAMVDVNRVARAISKSFSSGPGRRTTRTTNTAVAANPTRRLVEEVRACGENDSGQKPRSDILTYQTCQNLLPEFKASLTQEELQPPSTGSSIESSTQAEAESSLDGMDIAWEGEAPEERQEQAILQTLGEEDSFTSKGKRIYNNVKDTVKLVDEWVDPITLSTENDYDYANEILTALRRVDPEAAQEAVSQSLNLMKR